MQANRMQYFVLVFVALLLAINSVDGLRRDVCIDNLTIDKVVPDVIDTQPKNAVDVFFPTGIRAEQGNTLTPTLTKAQPVFKYPSQDDRYYTIAIVDPDAPSPNNSTFSELLHFLIANVRGQDLYKADILAEYIGPAPPKCSPYHRYVILVYEQMGGKYTSDIQISRFSIDGRLKFSIRKFALENDLGQPIAANFFYAEYDDYVPIVNAQLEPNQETCPIGFGDYFGTNPPTESGGSLLDLGLELGVRR